jgi:hypothetical protein
VYIHCTYLRLFWQLARVLESRTRVSYELKNLLKIKLFPCYNETMKHAIKTIGAGGQIYLGKEFAGQHVVVTEERKGVWVIKTADVIPHDEAWVHTPENKAKLDRALEWVSRNPSKVTTAEEAEELFQKALEGKDNK